MRGAAAGPRQRLASPLASAVLAASCAGVILAVPAWSRTQSEPAQPPPASGATLAPEETGTPAPPRASEVVPRSFLLAEEARAAEAAIDRLRAVSALVKRINDAEARLQTIEVRSQPADEPADGGSEARGGVETVAGALRVAFGGLQTEVSDRLSSLESVRRDWRGKRRIWTAWREQLHAEGLLLLDADLSGSVETTERIIRRAEGAFEDVLGVQRRVEELRLRLEAAAPRSPAVLPVRGTAWRDSPILGSAAYRRQLREDLAARTLEGLRAVSLPGATFRESSGGVIVFQLLLAVGLGWFFSRVRLPASPGDAETTSLKHPWVAGVFVSVATTSLFYSLLAPSWAMLLRVLFAGSLALLVRELAPRPLAGRYPRRVLRVLALTWILVEAAELVRLPAALARLPVLAAAAALGVVLLGVRRRPDAEPEPTVIVVARRLGVLVLALVAVFEVLGFDAVARWLFRSTAATALLIVTVALLAHFGRWLLSGWLAGPTAERFPSLRESRDHLARSLSWLLQALLLVMAAAYGLSLWGVSESPRAGLTEILRWRLPLGSLELDVGSLLLALLTLYLGFVLAGLSRAGIDRWSRSWEGVDPGVGDFIQRLVHYGLLAFGFLFALSVLGFELRNLTIILGALGVGIGLGLQSIVNNFFSGLILLVERPVRVGDLVALGTEWGTVRKIGLRSTVVATFDQAELVVPNSELVSQRVTNWTLSDRVSRVAIPVGVAYGSDVPKVFRLLAEVAAADGRVLEDPQPVVLFVGFGESSLDFELRVWVGDPTERLPVSSDLRAEIDRCFRAEDVEIPFPQRDLHLRSLEARVGSRPDGEPPASGGG